MREASSEAERRQGRAKAEKADFAPSKDEVFENLCQLCRAQNLDHTSELAIVARPRTPKLLVARRSAKARERSPEHLHLDRRQLGRCPVLEEESMLRLVNYQNNAIARIEHLDGLPHLAFLDLYDNKIQSIENLECCKNLRVLMLGKNQIHRIENLNTLEKLDVLDLHSNRIKEIQNVSHLKHLRVLNLAGNLLQSISGLEGLSALAELNIRRNAIASTSGLERVPQLQRVFASHNHIVTHEGLRALGTIPNLRELSLDGNPVVEAAEAQVYRAHILSLCPALDMLDNVKAEVQRGMLRRPQRSGEPFEFNVPSVPSAKLPAEPDSEAKESKESKASIGIKSLVISPSPGLAQVPEMPSPPSQAPDEKNNGSSGVQRPELPSFTRTMGPSAYQAQSARPIENSLAGQALNIGPCGKAPRTTETPKAAMTSEDVLQAIETQWHEVLKGHTLMTRHGYVKREHAKELSIFGRGLDALDKPEYQSTVTSIYFHYILIEVLTNEILRLGKFKDLTSITFVKNQIRSPSELEPFRKIARLRSVSIKENPLCVGRANLRVNILRWLPQLRKINGHEVQDFERVEASNLRAALPVAVANTVPEDDVVEERQRDTVPPADSVDRLMNQACNADRQCSIAQLHFEDIVRDAIREVWLDLHTERSGIAPAMPLPSSGFTIDE